MRRLGRLVALVLLTSAATASRAEWSAMPITNGIVTSNAVWEVMEATRERWELFGDGSEFLVTYTDLSETGIDPNTWERTFSTNIYTNTVPALPSYEFIRDLGRKIFRMLVYDATEVDPMGRSRIINPEAITNDWQTLRDVSANWWNGTSWSAGDVMEFFSPGIVYNGSNLIAQVASNTAFGSEGLYVVDPEQEWGATLAQISFTTNAASVTPSNTPIWQKKTDLFYNDFMVDFNTDPEYADLAVFDDIARSYTRSNGVLPDVVYIAGGTNALTNISVTVSGSLLNEDYATPGFFDTISTSQTLTVSAGTNQLDHPFIDVTGFTTTETEFANDGDYVAVRWNQTAGHLAKVQTSAFTPKVDWMPSRYSRAEALNFLYYVLNKMYITWFSDPESTGRSNIPFGTWVSAIETNTAANDTVPYDQAALDAVAFLQSSLPDAGFDFTTRFDLATDDLTYTNAVPFPNGFELLHGVAYNLSIFTGCFGGSNCAITVVTQAIGTAHGFKKEGIYPVLYDVDLAAPSIVEGASSNILGKIDAYSLYAVSNSWQWGTGNIDAYTNAYSHSAPSARFGGSSENTTNLQFYLVGSTTSAPTLFQVDSNMAVGGISEGEVFGTDVFYDQWSGTDEVFDDVWSTTSPGGYRALQYREAQPAGYNPIWVTVEWALDYLNKTNNFIP